MYPRHSRAFFWVAVGFASVAAAQPCTPEWSDRFASPPVINGEVRGLAFFDDGTGRRLYAGGTFDRAGGQVARGLVRWEGDRWAEFGGGVQPITPSLQNGTGVFWVGSLDTGSGPGLYITGTFTTAGGVPAKNVARWTGSAWAPMGPGLNDNVRALATYNDGTGTAIYASGKFTASGTAPMAGIARWNGADWQPVGGGLSGSWAAGYSLTVMDLGQGPRLVTTGQFTHAGGVLAGGVAAWDGHAWSDFGGGFPGAAFPGTLPLIMKSMLFDHGSGPQLTVGGQFTFVAGGESRPRVARWTGTSWAQVGTDLGAEYYEYVSSLAAIDTPTGPALYAGGPFHTATWLNEVNYIARLQAGDWVTVDGGMKGSIENFYLRNLITTEEGGRQVLYAAGGFAIAGDAVASRVARWDGTRWEGLERLGGLTPDPRNTNPTVPGGNAACPFDDGSGEQLFVGGEFLAAGDRVSNSIGAWNGTSWRTLGGGLTNGGDWLGRVEALLPFDDGSGPALYATGNFTQAGGGPCFSIARWNGAGWTAPGGSGILRFDGAEYSAGYGNALASFDDGGGPALYVGGNFHLAGGIPAGGIARWDGATWSPVGTGAGVPKGNGISTLAVFDEGSGPRLFAGGGFESIDGVPLLAIGRWDGTQWSSVGGGFTGIPGDNALVVELAVIDDGTGPSLVAAGCEGVVPLTQIPLLARWDGVAWEHLPLIFGGAPITGVIRSLAEFDDGMGSALYAGGNIRVNGTQNPGFLRFRLGAWETAGAGVAFTPVPSNTRIDELTVWRQEDRAALFATGTFDRAGPLASTGVGMWLGCAPCYPDCNGDSALNLSDFGCFTTKFALADFYADCNSDGALNLADFGCFQTRFALGCP